MTPSCRLSNFHPFRTGRLRIERNGVSRVLNAATRLAATRLDGTEQMYRDAGKGSMRAQLQDPQVCNRCWGTGAQTFQVRGYSYSRNCAHVPQRELPMEAEEEQKETEAA